ncbi:MAG: hypothetical protein AAF391_03995, partial [Bacteroidota bacterium]
MDITEAANTAPQFRSAVTANFDEETTGTVLDVDARDEYDLFASGHQGTPEDFNITYSLSGTDAALFDINTSSGIITFLTPPDFEIPSDNGGDNVYDIIVTANDGLSSMQNIAITVQNTFESVTFTTSPTASVAENTTPVVTLTSAGANPAGTVSYSISGGDDQALFSLTGADLSFASGPDFEVPGDVGADNTYEVQVTVDDTFTTDDLLISVSVMDEDEAPVAVLLSNNTLAENGAVDDVIGTLSVQNPDAGDTHTYLINGTSSNADFKISGDQLLANRAFNFEAEPNVAVDITARDGGGQELTETLTIFMTDNNDAPQLVSLSNTDISEDAPIGTVVGTLSTTDPDNGDTHTYSLTVGFHNDLFEIVGDELRTVAASFDFETAPDLLLQVESNDGNGGTIQTVIMLNVTDVNEAPVFVTGSSLNVNENISAVTSLEATDVDAGSTLTFGISGGDDQAQFNLSGSDLSFMSAPNFETPADQNSDNIYEVQVSVSDGTNTVDLLLAVTVFDVNEPQPPLTATEGVLYEFSVDPFAYLSSPGVVTAPTLPSWLTLSAPLVQLQETLTGSEASSYQSVESTVVGDDGKSYVLFVGGITALVVDPEGTDVTINLTGFDQFAVHPRRIAVDPAGNMYISDNDRIVKVEPDETHTVVTSSLTAAKDLAWHPDGFLVVLDGTIIKKVETNGTITNLVTGLSTNAVAVSVSSAGDMFYAETGTFDPMNVDETIHQFQLDGTVGANVFSPDFLGANESTYEMRDIVTDSQGRIFAHFWWTDEFANIFDRIELIQGTGNTEIVSHTTDVNSQKIINITMGSGDELFYIDADLAGTITYIRSYSSAYSLSGTPGSEDGGDHNVTLAISNGVDQLDLSFVINVETLNSPATDFTLSSTDFDEGVPVGTVVGTFSATDPDAVNNHIYTLNELFGNNDAFQIIGNELQIAQVTDFDSFSGPYSIQVQLDDSGDILIRDFSITLNNINVAPSDITLSNETISEESGVGSLVGNLIVSDTDGDDTHTFTFTDNTTSNADFFIDGIQLKNNRMFDFETEPTLDVEIVVTDAGSNTFNKVFTITVIDAVDGPTDIALSNTSVNENVALGTVVGSLSTTDQDVGDTHTYEILSTFNFEIGGVVRSPLAIDGNNLVTDVVIDHESFPSFMVRIQTTDSFGASISEDFTITVDNVNEAPTDLQLSSDNINEDAAVGSIIGSLLVNDVDPGDTHTYTVLTDFTDPETGNSFFPIIADGANLITTVPLDFEAIPSFTIDVQVEDAAGLTYMEAFTLFANDVNEAPTAMTLSANTIAENTAAGVRVGLLIGDDQDANDVLTYSLVAGTGDEGNAFFQIGGAGGNEIENAAILDFETQSTYSVRARVEDAAGLSLEQVFTIEVTDNNDGPTDATLSSATVAENSAIGTLVGSFAAVDQDAGDTHSFTFNPNNPDNSFFSIDGANLLVNDNIDFESTPTLTIGITVNDAAAANSFEK